MRRPLLATLLALTLGGCVAPMTPAERLSFAAYDMNAATRFGRMDVAVGHVAVASQSNFLRRHASWGRELRIVDVDLSGIRMLTPSTAEVHLSVSWHHDDETIMRQSFLAQRWTTEKGDDWQLHEELQIGGDEGLFAKLSPKAPPTAEEPPRPPDTMGQITHEGWQ